MSGVFGACPGGDRLAAHQVRQVGAEAAVGHRAGDRVAVHAGLLLEDAAALLGRDCSDASALRDAISPQGRAAYSAECRVWPGRRLPALGSAGLQIWLRALGCIASSAGSAIHALELLRSVDIDAQQHLGVLRAAELGALPDVHAGLMRIDPHLVHAVRKQVGLAGESREPRSCE